MKRPIIPSIFCAILLAVTPLSVWAEGEPVPEELPEVLPAVIITKVQTGNAGRADEFIELYNTTDQPVDLTGWQLRYVTASATSQKDIVDPSGVIELVPPVATGGAVLLPAGGYYLLHAGSVVPPDGAIAQPYAALLPATGGSLVLVRPDVDTCELVVEDALAWGSTAHLFGEGEALLPGSSSSSDRLFRRYVSTEGVYVDTNNNASDFAAGAAGTLVPMPGDNPELPDAPLPGSGMLSQPYGPRFANPDCVSPADPGESTDPPASPVESPPAIIEPPVSDSVGVASKPSIPAANIGLKPPVLSELLPNPAAPQTDKNDEFIELYNPNDAYFDLSGYMFEVGGKTKKRYTIPSGTRIAPRSFLAFFSADTRLALSNSGSQVALLDPLGRTLAVSEPYGTAKDGQAWVFASGIWQWTTKPTPNAINVVSAPAVKSKSTSKKSSVSTASTARSGAGGQAGGIGSAEDIEQAAAIAAASSAPLHPGVLALIAASAVLYGAYEYRRDVANRIHQFRANRAARRALRQSVKGG